MVAETLEEAEPQGQALDGSDAKKPADFLLEHLWKRTNFFFPSCVPVYPRSILPGASRLGRSYACCMQNPHSKHTSLDISWDHSIK